MRAEGDLHQPSTLLPSPATDPLSSPLAPSLFLANGSVDVNSTAVTMVVTNATFDGPNGTYVERGARPARLSRRALSLCVRDTHAHSLTPFRAVITVDGATRVLANGSEVAVFTFEGLSLVRACVASPTSKPYSDECMHPHSHTHTHSAAVTGVLAGSKCVR